MLSVSNGHPMVLKWQNIHVIPNTQYTAIFSKTWPSNLLYIQQSLFQNIIKRLRWSFFKNSQQFSLVNYFCKKLHLRCLTGFWIWFCPVNRKNNQTTYKTKTSHRTTLITGKLLKQPLERNLMNGIKWLTCKAGSSTSSIIFFD